MCLTSFAFAEEDVNPGGETLGDDERELAQTEPAQTEPEVGTFTVRYTADDNWGILDSSDEESEEGEEQPE